MLPGMRNLNGKEGLTVPLYLSRQLGSLDHQRLLKSKKSTVQLKTKQHVAICLLKATQLQHLNFIRWVKFANFTNLYTSSFHYFVSNDILCFKGYISEDVSRVLMKPLSILYSLENITKIPCFVHMSYWFNIWNKHSTCLIIEDKLYSGGVF